MTQVGPIKKIPIANLEKETTKCRYCHKEVQYSALPIHEYNCGLTKSNRPPPSQWNIKDDIPEPQSEF